MTRTPRSLLHLARDCGVQTSYRDVFKQTRHASAETLVRILSALGFDIDSPAGAAEAARELEAVAGGRLCEPCTVSWQRSRPVVRLARDPGRVECALRAETRPLGAFSPEAASWVHPGGVEVDLPADLAIGVYELVLTSGGRQVGRTTVLRAPERAPESGPRRWGVFAPLYALRTNDDDWGAGDFTSLRTLAEWTAGRGGDVVATLPLCASFLDEPFEPSPYSPVSRLFPSELWCDPSRVPEAAYSDEVRAAVQRAREAVGALQDSDVVDYRAVMKAKRGVLETAAGALSPARAAQLEEWLAGRPDVAEYARFRATCEHYGAAWTDWPDANLAGGPSERYYAYAQFATDEQFTATADAARDAGVTLYADLPVGVNGGGYDVWRFPEAFATGAEAGAPPDSFFRRGQGWGFPPLQPHATRFDGHAYYRACLRAVLQRAGILRIDHVMGLHRMWWVPRGASPAEGAYVRYPQEELWAAVLIEAHQVGAVIAGENLGTVPQYVDQTMRRRGVLGSFVLQYECDPKDPLPPVPAESIASLNTHDMPPFTSWWTGTDIDSFETLGVYEAEEAAEESQRRADVRAALAASLPTPPDGESVDADKTSAVTSACHRHLAEGDASIVLVNMEDLWGETRPQNIPGTTADQAPNFRRRFAVPIDDFDRYASDVEEIERLRGGRPEEPVSRTDSIVETTRSPLTDLDLHLFNEGTHAHLYRKLGAHLTKDGVHFGVWAPDAREVSVVGDFNGWNPSTHPLTPRGSSGIWEGLVPGITQGTLYKFHVSSRVADYRQDKVDPFGFAFEVPPKTASVVWDLDYEWGDSEWMKTRAGRNSLSAPMSTYELHIGSWAHVPGKLESFSYRDLAPRLADHLERTGFTHVELMPVMEHPFYGSWGYQCTGYFAPTSRFGTPQDFMYFVDHLHQRGFGVILDWVPSHFPTDAHALGFFDGTHLYEHADPRLGIHPDWASYIFNYGRNEVRSFLMSSALFWLDVYHADGLRVDAVASMLYLDYSREHGEWIPNEHGGRENLRAIELLRDLNTAVYREYPDTQTIAEESTAWPSVSRPAYTGGLGFGLKWDMGWMHDTLGYFAREPIHRRWHHNELTFRMIYAFNENFVLPLSHDEVVHGKGSLAAKMPGDDWQKLANLRALYGYMWGQSGKKLLFMGGEFAQWREWDHNAQLDWHLLEDEGHAGVCRWVGDLNRFYREQRAMHELDCDPAGFEWVDASDSDASVISFLRVARDGSCVLCVFNLTPIPRYSYRIGVPQGGTWREALNSDSEIYGGSGVGNYGSVEATPMPLHGRPRSLTLTLPPLAALFLTPE